MEKATLFQWLMARAEEAKTVPDSKLAESASTDLNLRVTAPNILYARKSLGIEKPKPEKPVVVSLDEWRADVDRRIDAYIDMINKILINRSPSE
jgi:hypothetical protein